MDWIRRNWPDLLILVALVAVIGGIIATLLTGGSFFPLGQSPSPMVQNETPPGSAAPAAGTRPAPSPGTNSGTNSGTTPGTTPGTNAGSAAAPGTAPATAGGATAPTDDIAVLPPAGASRNPGDAAPTTPASGSVAPGTAANPGTGTAAPSASTPSVPAASTVPTAAAAQLQAPYRVAVGAFSSEANARRQLAEFQDAGFPVFLGQQNDLYLVLVGPYDSDALAEQAADRIRASEFAVEPVIYRYQADEVKEVPATTAQTSTPASTSTAAATVAPTPTASSAPASGVTPAASEGPGVYLQVGAYANRESSLPHRQRLENLGFQVSERQEGTLVKLLVGPFGGARLDSARQQLTAQGIDFFARSN